MSRLGLVLSALFCLLLAACGATKPGMLAGPDGNKDGQSLTAKPGMGRLYLIQGSLTDGPVPVDSVTEGAPDFYVYGQTYSPGVAYVPTPGRLTPMAAGSLVGNIAAAIIQSTQEKPTSWVRLKPLVPRSYFYIGKDKLADIGEGDYIALDLAPGSYEIKLCLGLRDCPVAPVTIEAQKVVYLLSDADTPNGPYFEVCRKECGQAILGGRRVIAWDPATKALQAR